MQLRVMPKAGANEIKEFNDSGIIYGDKTYDMKILASMGFKSLRYNLDKYRKSHGLITCLDMRGRRALTGVQLEKFIVKKMRLPSKEESGISEAVINEKDQINS